ncbi:unnamed protein product [Amoebophrya sp. A25]|nr:unnamed protein product [Amoebophrya sp. A25]|eukprot:GSA25T00014698001.1
MTLVQQQAHLANEFAGIFSMADSKKKTPKAEGNKKAGRGKKDAAEEDVRLPAIEDVGAQNGRGQLGGSSSSATRTQPPALPAKSPLLLRPYQQAAVDAVLQRDLRMSCLVMPCGSGKTLVGYEICRRVLERSRMTDTKGASSTSLKRLSTSSNGGGNIKKDSTTEEAAPRAIILSARHASVVQWRQQCAGLTVEGNVVSCLTYAKALVEWGKDGHGVFGRNFASPVLRSTKPAPRISDDPKLRMISSPAKSTQTATNRGNKRAESASGKKNSTSSFTDLLRMRMESPAKPSVINKQEQSTNPRNTTHTNSSTKDKRTTDNMQVIDLSDSDSEQMSQFFSPSPLSSNDGDEDEVVFVAESRNVLEPRRSTSCSARTRTAARGPVLVVLDECHIAPASKVLKFLRGLRSLYPALQFVSLTATLLRESKGFREDRGSRHDAKSKRRKKVAGAAESEQRVDVLSSSPDDEISDGEDDRYEKDSFMVSSSEDVDEKDDDEGLDLTARKLSNHHASPWTKIVGEVVYSIEAEELIAQNFLMPVECIQILLTSPTAGAGDLLDAEGKILLSSPTGNLLEEENAAIQRPSSSSEKSDLVHKIQALEGLLLLHQNDTILILVESRELARRISIYFGICVLDGSVPKKTQEQILDHVRSNNLRCLIAVHLLDESCDLPNLNVVIQLGGFFGSRRQEQQRIGRLRRVTEKKLADLHHRDLERKPKSPRFYVVLDPVRNPREFRDMQYRQGAEKYVVWNIEKFLQETQFQRPCSIFGMLEPSFANAIFDNLEEDLAEIWYRSGGPEHADQMNGETCSTAILGNGTASSISAMMGVQDDSTGEFFSRSLFQQDHAASNVPTAAEGGGIVTRIIEGQEQNTARTNGLQPANAKAKEPKNSLFSDDDSSSSSDSSSSPDEEESDGEYTSDSEA